MGEGAGGGGGGGEGSICERETQKYEVGNYFTWSSNCVNRRKELSKKIYVRYTLNKKHDLAFVHRFCFMLQVAVLFLIFSFLFYMYFSGQI